MFKDFLGKKDVWYIVDAREPMEYRAKTILICSPQKIYYKMFDTLGIDVRFMPVWSPAEIDICRNNIDIFKHLTAKEVQDLYYKWGGVPRFVLLHAHNCTMQMQLDMAISEVKKSITNFVGENSSGNNVSHKLVHICTNVPDKEEEEEMKVKDEEKKEEEEA